MPFVSIHTAGQTTRAQRAALTEDITKAIVERLGKPVASVQIVFHEMPLDAYAAGGMLIADRPPVHQAEDAPADGPR